MEDAAFTPQTDPHPNPTEPFRQGLENSGIVLNARMVGDPEVVRETTQQLWSPGMKLIAVTFSQSPGEQQKAYDMIHQIASFK
jgi:hypothetical protein